MKKRLTFVLAVLTSILFTSVSMGAFTASNDYQSTVLVNTSGTFTVAEGLAVDGQKIYYGNYDSIKSYDLSNASTSTAGSITYDNAGISFVARSGGVTHVSYGTSYNAPQPYKAGYIDNGSYVNQLDMDGIYDIAINSLGQAYIVSNPGGNGTEIYNYDLSTGDTTLIADIGGYSGGIAFDSAGNLYYADQGIVDYDPVTYAPTVIRASMGVIKFEASQVAAGNLTIDDAVSVVGIGANYIEFDDDDNLIATYGYATSTVSLYETLTGTKLGDFGYGSGAIGKVIWDNDTLYVVETDFVDYASTINAVVVPEPLTVLLLGLGSIGLVRRKSK